MRNTRDNTSKGLTVIKHMSNISIPGLQNRPIIKLFIKYTKRSLQLALTSPGLAILIWDFPNIPRNENFNLLVRIKFLNLFLYTVVLNKNEIIYWSEQSFTGLRLEDQCSAWGLQSFQIFNSFKAKIRAWFPPPSICHSHSHRHGVM
jgi:hypothetical protein